MAYLTKQWLSFCMSFSMDKLLYHIFNSNDSEATQVHKYKKWTKDVY